MNKLIYQKDGQDYFLRAKGKNLSIYEFIIIKQGREGYSVDAYKWINNNMHTTRVDFCQDNMNLKSAKEMINNFLNN